MTFCMERFCTVCAPHKNDAAPAMLNRVEMKTQSLSEN
jgi:hypothetical protein